MTAFSTPCTVLTVTSTGAIEIEHLDCLEDARQYINDFPGEEEAQTEPWDDEDDAEWTPEYFGVRPGIDFPATLCRAW